MTTRRLQPRVGRGPLTSSGAKLRGGGVAAAPNDAPARGRATFGIGLDARLGQRRPAADHRWRQPGPAALLSLLRSVVRLRRSRPAPPHRPPLTATDRHRLSRDGDRQAIAALHHIVKSRMTNDPRTRAYRDTHLGKGWTKKAVYRTLERTVAREVFAAVSGRCEVPQYGALRPAR